MADGRADAGTADAVLGPGISTLDDKAILSSAALRKPAAEQAPITRIVANQPGYWGVPAEQDLAFYLGQQGYNVVLGPGGATGKSAFAKGIDILAVKTLGSSIEILLGDNKASGVPGDVRECSAFTEDVANKLATLRTKVAAAPEFPERAQVLDKLDQTVTRIRQGGGQSVEGVRWVIANAGGFASGVTEKLQADFFAATKLTNPKGLQARIEFMGVVPPAEINARNDLVKALGGKNPRNPTRVEITEPRALNGWALKGNAEGAWILGLQVVEWIITTVLGLLVDPVWKRQLQALSPTVVKELAVRPGDGVLLVAVFWEAAYSPRDLTDTAAAPHPVIPEFTRWETSYARTADEAFAQWAAPAKLGEDRSNWTPPQHRRFEYFWFDGENMARYKPPLR
jgi:hypothetical protein